MKKTFTYSSTILSTKLFLSASVAIFSIKAYPCTGPAPQGKEARELFNTAIIDMLKSTQIPVAPDQISLSNVQFNGGARGDCQAKTVIGDLKIDYTMAGKKCVYDAKLSAFYSKTLGNEVYVHNLNKNECSN